MKKRVISFMMSAVLTLSGLGCYGLANVHAETDTNMLFLLTQRIRSLLPILFQFWQKVL